MSGPVIHQINVSNGGVPKRSVASGDVRKTGLVGDAHAKPGIHGGPTRALSLYSLECIERLAAAGHPISPGSTGENVTLSGLDWRTLEPGMRVRLGADLLVEITSYAEPCRTIAGSFRDGRVRPLSQISSPGQARLYCQVLEEGVIRPGDPVRLEEAPSASVRSTGPGVEANPGSNSEQENEMQDVRLAYVNLYVTDLGRSVEFFGKTLGLPLQFEDASFGYASFDAGPVRLGLAQVDAQDEDQRANVGRMTGFGFAVRDLAAAHAELAAAGVAFPMKPSKQPWGGFMALFTDPDGNTFYLDELPL